MIRVLDKFIADKIAAGEVIERPVSAVKELVENSIDAGAHSIIVEIRGGGKSYIRVTDDGCGIAPDEVETAFLRHATSKISSITDLDNIRSLGFRGEALASIAAVSKLTIITRTQDRPAGTRLMMHGGRVISKETAGANKGTTIVVEDLFYNTPARRKFMGTDAREGSAVIELLQQYAVCWPFIKFMVIRNGEKLQVKNDDNRDVGVIYKDGHMEVYLAHQTPVDEILNDPDVWQVLGFGPSLLDENGQPKTTFNDPNQVGHANIRNAVGYFEPGHYCFVYVPYYKTSDRYSCLDMQSLSQLMYQLGCVKAYNLDGGATAGMFFNGKLVTDRGLGQRRQIHDFYYIPR